MITKLSLDYYRQRKVKNNFNVKEDQISIHKVINSQCGYDPHNMKKFGTRRHNSLSLLRSYYNRYTKGGITLDEFIRLLTTRKDLNKYSKRFKKKKLK